MNAELRMFIKTKLFILHSQSLIDRRLELFYNSQILTKQNKRRNVWKLKIQNYYLKI
jgi:hypothetical protein